MKTLILILLPFAAISQKPVASIFGGISNHYQINAGIEAGVSKFGNERLTLLASGQYNYSGGITYSVSANFAHWLDTQKEAFVAPVFGLWQLPSLDETKAGNKPFKPCIGLRYQVYGGFGQIQTNFNYVGVQVGYQFGNRKF